MENEIGMIIAPPKNPPAPLPNLPEEIIAEILLRLPVKPLLKFRCVAKSWDFLISSYNFAKAHLKISTKNNIYVHDRLVFGSKVFPMDLYTCSLLSAFEDIVSTGSIYPATDENFLVDRVWFDYPLYKPKDLIQLVGSCNGLVCVSLSVYTVILWNPTTRKLKVLPDSGTIRKGMYGKTFGFGFDEKHDDYKVVEFASSREIQVKVYSLRADSWKILSNWPGGNTTSGTGKFFNGAIHWSVFVINAQVEWAIVSLDLATNSFAKLPLPNFEDVDIRVEITVLEGCLSVCCGHKYMDVWIMKEYGVKESWTKLVRIPFSFSSVFLRPSLLFLMVDGRIVINCGSSLGIYDPRNPQIYYLGDSCEVEATTYFESLVSPDL